MPDPLDPGTAKRRIRQILTGGRVAFGTHAKQEMGKDRLDAVDVTNVLRCGAVNVNQYVGNDWRYTIETGPLLSKLRIAFSSPSGV